MKRGNIWFFPVLKTLGPHDATAPIQQTTHLNKPLVQSRPAGHSLASRGIGSLRDASSSGRKAGLALGSDTSAPNPGMGGKGDGDIGCHHPPVPLCLSRHQPHGKTSDLSEASLGLGFCKKTPPTPLFQSKVNGSTQVLQLLQNPPCTAEPRQYHQHRGKGTKRLLGGLAGGPRPCSPVVAFQWGLLTPAGSTKLATLPRSASASPPQHPAGSAVGAGSTRQRCHPVLSNKHHGCRTAEENGPRQSKTSPVHPLISPFHFVTLPRKGEKNQKPKPQNQKTS